MSGADREAVGRALMHAFSAGVMGVPITDRDTPQSKEHVVRSLERAYAPPTTAPKPAETPPATEERKGHPGTWDDFTPEQKTRAAEANARRAEGEAARAEIKELGRQSAQLAAMQRKLDRLTQSSSGDAKKKKEKKR